jgi:hypothetical protein
MSDKPYEVKAYSHQISDTGDYDGHWEITNGKVTLFTKDDPDDEVLQKVADALNESGCEFYLDDSDAFLRHHFEKENKELNLILPALEQTIIDQDKVILEQRKEIERLEADKSNYLNLYTEVLDQNEKIAQRAKDLKSQVAQLKAEREKIAGNAWDAAAEYLHWMVQNSSQIINDLPAKTPAPSNKETYLKSLNQ